MAGCDLCTAPANERIMQPWRTGRKCADCYTWVYWIRYRHGADGGRAFPTSGWVFDEWRRVQDELRRRWHRARGTDGMTANAFRESIGMAPVPGDG